MEVSTAPALERARASSSALAALLARHASDGTLSARLGVPGTALPRREIERTLLRPAVDFLARPGKGLREELVRLGWELGGGEGEAPAELRAAVELLHAGSLIIDDIEDGSGRRRGAPALHRRYGVPLALNTGNALYFWALELLGELAEEPAKELALRRCANRAVLRCHYGQALDLGVRVDALRQRDVPSLASAIGELKTGSLTELAASLGAIAAGASPARERALARFALRVGVAFQMLDDLANLRARERGKRYEDLRLARVTWPWAWCARRLAPAAFATLRVRARAVAAGALPPGDLARALRGALGPTGRSSAEAWLARAVTGLRSAVPGTALGSLDAALTRARARCA
jgi:geranylgeranyl pyrophosphate synthase